MIVQYQMYQTRNRGIAIFQVHHLHRNMYNRQKHPGSCDAMINLIDHQIIILVWYNSDSLSVGNHENPTISRKFY